MKANPRFIGVAAGICLVATVLVSTSPSPILAQGNGALKLDCDTRPCDSVARGRAAFNDRELEGNSLETVAPAPIATCRLTRSSSHRRWPAPDCEVLLARRARNKERGPPLLGVVDAEDVFRINGDNASDFSNLVENGLIRVTMPLPGERQAD